MHLEPAVAAPGRDGEADGRGPDGRRSRGGRRLQRRAAEPDGLLPGSRATCPRHDHERRHDRDPEQREQDDPGLDVHPPRLRRGRASRACRGLLLADDEAGVVFVHVELAVEPEVLGIRAQKPLHVRLGRQHVELLVLERPEVFGADLGRLLDLGEIESLAHPRLAKAGPNLEHGGASV